MCLPVIDHRPSDQCDNYSSTHKGITNISGCTTNISWEHWENGQTGVDKAEFNYSAHNFPNEIWIVRENWEIAVKILFVIPIVIFGIIGNVAIINIVVRNTFLRSPTNMLLANMAAADALTLLICPPMFLVSDLFQNYVLGKGGCKTEGFFSCAFLLTAVLNLCIVSYDRLTAITLPPEAKLTHNATKVIMAVTWASGFLIALPLIIFRNYKERQWKNFLEQYCTEDTTVLPVYWYIILILLVWFPLSVTTMSYTTIFLKVTESFHEFWFAAKYFLYVNAAINPLIYGFTNESFRRAFRTLPVSRWVFGNSNILMSPLREEKQRHSPTPAPKETKHKTKKKKSKKEEYEQRQ
ncbi:neuropeptide Y receptor type 2 isoform X2 [Schistocerca gregaria]|uniref:neuropeptide Y receptor type 2 isoform X2 n=1 Tax=Schistocerca gregaria TaxID=7010 RepID=UPI00211EBD00|nr:neuropeptide Y receptor type 2 isoform X2 [Schistocerca gregaria]